MGGERSRRMRCDPRCWPDRSEIGRLAFDHLSPSIKILHTPHSCDRMIPKRSFDSAVKSSLKVHRSSCRVPGCY